MKEFKTCPRKYFYSTVVGYKPKIEPPYFSWGKAYHKFRELLSRTYLEVYHDPKHPKIFEEALAAGMAVYREKFPKGPPPGKWDWYTSALLMQSLNLSYKRWQDEMLTGQFEIIAVEQPFSLQYTPQGHYRNGRLDELVKINGKPHVRDYKTSAQRREYFKRGLEPNDQAISYIYAANQLLGYPVVGALFDVLHNDGKTTKAQPFPKTEMYTELTTRTQTQIEKWQQDQQIWHAYIDMCRVTDIYPMNEAACTYCDYHIVCRGFSENQMLSQLKSHFIFRPYDNSQET
jgi:hypothetical protein